MNVLVKSRSGLGDAIIAYNLAYALCRVYEFHDIYLHVPTKYAQLFHSGPARVITTVPKVSFEIFFNMDSNAPRTVKARKVIDCNDKWWGLETHSYPVTMFLNKVNQGHLKVKSPLPIKHHIYPKKSSNIVFCNSSKEDVKCFSPDVEQKFLKTLSSKLPARRSLIEVVGGQLDTYENLKRVVDARGESIDDLARRIYNGTIFIGVDSGPMHMASSLGTFTIGIFGPTDWRTWLPPGRGAQHIKVGNCIECLKQRKDSPVCKMEVKCMDTIDIHRAINEIFVMWRERAEWLRHRVQ